MAIKIYERYKLREEIRAENLENELEILSRMNHRYVIKLYEHIQGDKLEFLIMEYGPKKMLSDFAKNYHGHRILEYESKIIFQKIVEAVAYLHDENVAHRDLKMQNILVDEEFAIKLIDFGFASVTSPKKKFTVFCGTYSYMSPELVNRVPYDGKASDVWSLGVLLYMMLVGDFPFKGSDQSEMAENIRRVNYVIPSFLSRGASDLIQSIFIADPKLRPKAMDILACDWLLDAGKESEEVKANQSTIFMESIDQMFKNEGE